MRRTGTRWIAVAALAAVALLTVGAGTAMAHGGLGFGFGAKSKKDANALLAAAAKNLGVSTQTLTNAILADANARIDKAVDDEKLDEDQAADLEDELAANPSLAIPLTTATGVARRLDTTKAKLDDAFQKARKDALIAKVDQAVKDDRLTEDQAADIKDEINENAEELPGYKGGLGLGLGFHLGFGKGFGGPGFGKHFFGGPGLGKHFFGGPIFGGARPGDGPPVPAVSVDPI